MSWWALQHEISVMALRTSCNEASCQRVNCKFSCADAKPLAISSHELLPRKDCAWAWKSNLVARMPRARDGRDTGPATTVQSSGKRDAAAVEAVVEDKPNGGRDRMASTSHCCANREISYRGHTQIHKEQRRKTSTYSAQLKHTHTHTHTHTRGQ